MLEKNPGLGFAAPLTSPPPYGSLPFLLILPLSPRSHKKKSTSCYSDISEGGMPQNWGGDRWPIGVHEGAPLSLSPSSDPPPSPSPYFFLYRVRRLIKNIKPVKLTILTILPITSPLKHHHLSIVFPCHLNLSRLAFILYYTRSKLYESISWQ